MSFGTPTALFWLALAVPIIGLYILKVRLRRVPVSTNLFWKQIYEEKPPRSLWQYLRHLLSLLLQLLMLGLLAVAIADPYLPWQLTQARRVVLVIDQSASMQATDLEPSRFGAAMEAARADIEGLRSHDEMAIILAGGQPHVAIGMTSHIPTLKRTLAVHQPTDGPTHLEPAIQLAHKLIGDHPKGQIIVLTDGCDDGAEHPDSNVQSEVSADETATGVDASNHQPSTIDHQPSIIRRIFATEAANVGIAQFQVRRSLIDPLGYEILAEVKNAGPSAVDCRLELELDGLPVDILPLQLEPEQLWSRSLEKTSLEGGRLSARLTEIAANSAEELSEPARDQPSTLNPQSTVNHLIADDVAWAVLPPREIQPVLVVTPGNLFLQKVFEANPLVAVEVRNELPDTWPKDTLVVLHQHVPETLPTRDVFVVDPAVSTNLWTLGETLANPIVTKQDADSPLMTHVRLDNVLMPQARKLEPTLPVRVLAGSVSNDPLYVELVRDGGKCLVLTVNLEESDLAFRTAFPIMVSNALGWYAGTSGELNRSLPTGDVANITITLPKEQLASRLRLVHPDGEEEDLAFADADSLQDGTGESAGIADESLEMAIGPLNQVGVYNVVGTSAEDELPTEADRPVLSSVAVNLASARETDLRPLADTADARGEDTTIAGWFSRPVWFYLAVVACVLTVAEWFLYQRRFID